MVSITVFSILALLTSSFTLAVPTADPSADALSPKFVITTSAYNGNRSLDGQYLVTYHTGAGTNALAFVPQKKDATQFQLTSNAFVVYHYSGGGQNYYYTVALDDTRPKRAVRKGNETRIVNAAPKGYRTTSANIGGKPRTKDSQGEYYIDGKEKGKKTLLFAPELDVDWNAFSVCYIKPSTYPLPGGNILLYRTKESTPDKSGQCADVDLISEFV